MHRLLWAAVVALVALGAGRAVGAAPSDWPMAGGGPGQSNANPAERTLQPQGLRLRWTLHGVEGPFIVAAGRVFGVTSKGQLTAWDAATGKVRRVYGATSTLGLAYAGGRLYAGGSELQAYDAASGRTMFRTHLSRPGARAVVLYPEVSGGVVYTAIGPVDKGYTARHYAVDAGNGRVLWSKPLKDTSIPCVLGGRVYLAYANQTGVAYDGRTGRTLWTRPKAGIGWMAAGASLISSTLGNGKPGETRAFTAAGAPRWTVKGADPIAASSTRIYVESGSGFADIQALDARTGRRVWVNYGVTAEPSSFAAALANGVLYVTRGTGEVVALDAAKGRTLAVLPAPLGYHDANFLAVANGMIFEEAVEQPKKSKEQIDLLAFGR